MFEWIYVDLDTILDTRLATYAIMNPDYPQRVIDAGYGTRVYDRFDDIGIPWDSWRAAYLKRDKHTLALATETNVLTVILAAIIDKERQAMTAPLLQPNLLINTYPYKLTEDELKTIKDSIKATLNSGAGLGIDFVNTSYRQMTPAWIEEKKIFDMYCTNGEDWLSIRLEREDITKKTCRNTTLHLPALVTAPTDDPEGVMNKGLAYYIDIMSPFIRMNFLISEVFSAKTSVVDHSDSPGTNSKST